MKSTMSPSHSFSQVPKADIQRSSFDRSHGFKTTFNAGYLVPYFVDEVLPGDTFNAHATFFARLATPFKPFMDNVFLDTFYFFVPYRLVWDNWQRFNGEQTNPGDSTDYVIPTVTSGSEYFTSQIGSLSDYFGIPVGTNMGDIITAQPSALPFRAYNLIWNEWFRDQNLQDSVNVPTDDGPDNLTINYWYDSGREFLLRRGKRHDYFTSCLPWPQKGDAVTIPLGSSAPVNYNYANTSAWGAHRADDGTATADLPGLAVSALGNLQSTVSFVDVQLDPRGNLSADLSSATAATINSLREAFQLQRMYERDARGGTRYTEIIRSHFGVVSPDMRLQRPEYLGGGSTRVNVSPVAQTAPTAAGSTPQGNLAAFATLAKSGDGFVKSFTEHGIIIGLMSIRADLTYQQGINKMWTRSTRFDFYWPALSHLGEQAVLKQEIYCGPDPTHNLDVFGYQERYAEYRYKPSLITGQYRSVATDSLDVWHLSQDFDDTVALNSDFISEHPPIERVVVVEDEPQFLLDAWIQLKCARPMPVYGVPGLIDHF